MFFIVFQEANQNLRRELRSPLLYRSDVVLPLKAQPKKMRNAKAFFQGLLHPFGARAIASQWSEPTARAQNTLLAECVHFQGPLRRCAPRAAFGGANRHPRTTVRSILFYRSDAVLPLKTQSKKMRNAEAFFQGLLRPFGARAIASQWSEPTSKNSASFSPALLFGCGSRPAKVQRKTRCKNASHFSWCTFRDSNPGPID